MPSQLAARLHALVRKEGFDALTLSPARCVEDEVSGSVDARGTEFTNRVGAGGGEARPQDYSSRAANQDLRHQLPDLRSLQAVRPKQVHASGGSGT